MTHNFSQILGIVTLIFSIVFFGLGVCFPLLSTHKQLIFIKFDYDEINLLDSIAMFFDDREYFLAAVILIFTFILPILKYIELTIRILRNKTTKILQNLDKWNMIDVFLVAL
ncbi:MAG: paraquat-inducible protein A, partial [Bacteroidales bacterium]|nr:paraquat-inducible protein A [Bacteroidales bacterium]